MLAGTRQRLHPGACGDCLNPAVSATSAFQTGAFNGWNVYNSMTCTTLAQQNVPAPPPPSDPTYGIQLGRWCAMQFLLQQGGCGQGATPGPLSSCPGQTLCVIKPPPCP